MEALLNDRSVPFPDRCLLVQNILGGTCSTHKSGPGFLQMSFEWFCGSLFKMTRSETGVRHDTFLHPRVWGLFYYYSTKLAALERQRSSGLKRSKISYGSAPSTVPFTVSYEPDVFVIRNALLPIFQTALELVKTAPVEDESFKTMLSCMIQFLDQSAVSMPVNLTQVMDFLGTIKHAASSSPDHVRLFQLAADVLVQVIHGQANYRKSYPALVAFLLDLSSVKTETDPLYPIILTLVQKCLFSNEESLGELSVFLSSAHFKSALESEFDASFDQRLPKTCTFQRVLFSAIIQERERWVDGLSLSIVFEGFLRGVGDRVTRELGFNFFRFLVSIILPDSKKADSAMPLLLVSKLVASLHARGNRIYQQRNDEIFAAQSQVIERILKAALAFTDCAEAFSLLSSLTELNVYLMLSQFDSILKSAKDRELMQEFITTVFKESATANQLTDTVNTFLQTPVQLNSAVLNSFAGLCGTIPEANFLTLLALLETSLSDKVAAPALSLFSMAVKSIHRVIPGNQFSVEKYIALQEAMLLEAERLLPKAGHKHAALLAKILAVFVNIIRFTPVISAITPKLEAAIVKFYSLDAENEAIFELVMVWHCKLSPGATAEILSAHTFTEDSHSLVLKYLPLVADFLGKKTLKKFVKWLFKKNPQILLHMLKHEISFYEIRSVQPVFLDVLVDCADSALFAEITTLLPSDYVAAEYCIRLCERLCVLDRLAADGLENLLVRGVDRTKAAESLKALYKNDKFVSWFANNWQVKDKMLGRAFYLAPASVLHSMVAEIGDQAGWQFYANLVTRSSITAADEIVSLIKSLLKRKSIREADLIHADVVVDWLLSLPATVASVKKMFKRMAEQLECMASESDATALRHSILLKLSSRVKLDQQGLLQSLFHSKTEEATFKIVRNALASYLKTQPAEGIVGVLEGYSLPIWDPLLMAVTAQLLECPSHAAPVFAWLLQRVEEVAMAKDIGGAISLLRSFIGLKSAGTWSDKLVARLLLVLRRIYLQAHEEAVTRSMKRQHSSDAPSKAHSWNREVTDLLRYLVDVHGRRIAYNPSLTNLMMSVLSEWVNVLGENPEEQDLVAFGRMVGQLTALRHGALDGFLLVPFVCRLTSLLTRSVAMNSSLSTRRPVKMVMRGLLQHVTQSSEQAQSHLQLMAAVFMPMEEERVVLKGFVDDFYKFDRYKGQI